MRVNDQWQFVHDYVKNWEEYVYIDWVGWVKKKDLPEYVDENLEFKVEKYLNDKF